MKSVAGNCQEGVEKPRTHTLKNQCEQYCQDHYNMDACRKQNTGFLTVFFRKRDRVEALHPISQHGDDKRGSANQTRYGIVNAIIFNPKTF